MDPVRIWAPNVIKNDIELEQYVSFCNSSCIPFACSNIEEALDLLYECNGDIQLATKRFMQNIQDCKKEQKNWTVAEVETFGLLMRIHGKNFYEISKELRNLVKFSKKTVKDCVKYYYLAKKSIFHNKDRNNNNTSVPSSPDVIDVNVNSEFPCKVCGRVFEKIKSRSAHMKRHKNERSRDS